MNDYKINKRRVFLLVCFDFKLTMELFIYIVLTQHLNSS